MQIQSPALVALDRFIALMIKSSIGAVMFVVCKMSMLLIQVVKEIVIRFTVAIPTVAVIGKEWVITTAVQVCVYPGLITERLTVVPIAKAISAYGVCEQMHEKINAGVDHAVRLIIPAHI